jgi:beta-N-acetylhexosaminidase
MHIGFAPTADVNNNPANPVINVRSFGEDPADVARLTSAFVRGMQRAGLAATAKHFPGHGDTDIDTHHALATVKSDRARLNAVELVPFRAAIASGIAGIMTAHIALPAVNDSTTPATLAPKIITDLLRDTLGFRGVTFTDAMSMEGIGQGYDVARSAVLAVQAGADVLLKPTDPTKAIDAVVAAVERGEIAQERIDRSVRRLLEMKARSGVTVNRIPNLQHVRAVVGAPEHWEVSNRIAGEAVTLLKDADSLLPVTRGQSVAVVSFAPDIEVLAGRAFGAEVRAAIPNARVVRITQRSAGAELDSLAAQLARMDRVIVTTHVRTIEGEGRNAIPAHIGAWIDSLAKRTKTIVVAHHNPYVIRQFPSVRSYVATFGMQETLERAAARAVTGRAPFRGRSPVSLPGIFSRGDGIQRGETAAAAGAGR